MSWTNLKLNEKYRQFIQQSFDATYNVLEGSWRSGKTTSLLLAHMLYLDDLAENGLHIVGAESIATARTILVNNPTGFSYMDFFAENCEQKQYEGKDALLIVNSRGKKQILVFVGTSKSNSWQSIRGLTAMSVFVTEANIAHRSFLDEAIGRTISTPSEYRKLYFDLNPKSNNDWFYKEFLNVWEERAQNNLITLNYMRTTYWDNPGLTDEQKQSISNEYDPESLLYRIYILGERLSQVDHVYVLRPANIVANPPKPDEYILVVDTGVSTSATTFVTMGAAKGSIYIYNTYYHKSGRDIEGPHVKGVYDYAKDLVDYTKNEIAKYGQAPSYIYLDRDVSFLRAATEVFRASELSHSLLKYAIKDDIEDRIKTTSTLLYRQKLFIDDQCKIVIEAFETAVYDSKALDEKGKLERYDVPNPNRDIMNPIDILDPIEYGVSYFIRRIKGMIGE